MSEIAVRTISIILSVISGVCVMLIPLVKNAKAKKSLEITADLTGILNKQLEFEKTADALMKQAVIDAETFKNYTGTEKLNYVMTRLGALFTDNAMPFKKEEWEKKINELVRVTKKVNATEAKKSLDESISVLKECENVLNGNDSKRAGGILETDGGTCDATE